jgi:hypothetical protein
MRNVRGSRHSLPNTQKFTIIAQDPSIKVGGHILTAEVDVPAEELLPGPCGYRVNVIDFDASTNTLFEPAVFRARAEGGYEDPFSVGQTNGARRKSHKRYDRVLLEDPRFHAQNVYAIVMRTLARFEFALGRRVPWGCDGHQLHLAPHAFAEPNAFYSREDRGIFFGYFAGQDGKPVFTALSHDVVAHETTHAILDGLRARYLEPSSPDQAAFHEGFADIVALLSVFSLTGIVAAMLDHSAGHDSLIDQKHLTRESLRRSALLGLADEMGSEVSGIRGRALRRSVELEPGLPYANMPEFQEEHRRGELLVAAIMNAFLDIWLERLAKIGFIVNGKRDRSVVVEEGARVAAHLLTMAIRAIDYCPPTDLTFSDYLSALLTIDQEVVPDDSKYRYREALLKNFAEFGISPAAGADVDGTWRRCDQELVYSRTHFDSMLRDKEEVFRFLWENRKPLNVDESGYVEVHSVRPCVRIGPDGFALRETVAEYIQILTLEARELETELGIVPPSEIPGWRRLRIFGGGALIFDEYGQLKYQIANHLARTPDDKQRQTRRLHHLCDSGFFDRPVDPGSRFAALHLTRAMS